MLGNFGFDVIDLGKDVDSAVIIDTAIETNADIIAVSALMTTTMERMREIVSLKNERGLDTAVIVGGAAVTESYCREIGADGYSKDASSAVRLAQEIIIRKES
jgi:5-methyltetrahydrofolate--homocysteine methyltransferase